MKYRLLDEETLGQMIDFLDTIQIEASKGKYKDDIEKINMCSYLISVIHKPIGCKNHSTDTNHLRPHHQ